LGLFSFKIWTCKNREKRIKNHIFIYNMHGMDVAKYVKQLSSMNAYVNANAINRVKK